MKDQNEYAEKNAVQQNAEIQPYNKVYILYIRPQTLPIG
jgi:hypothetical protein